MYEILLNDFLETFPVCTVNWVVMSSSVVKREWLGLEGHIQALNSNCGTYLNLSAQQTRASLG